MKVFYTKIKESVSCETLKRATPKIIEWLMENKNILTCEFVKKVDDRIENIHFFYYWLRSDITCKVKEEEGKEIIIHVPKELLLLPKKEMVKRVKEIIQEVMKNLKESRKQIEKQQRIINMLLQKGVEVEEELC